MAKLKIELIIGEGNGNILTFDETQVLDWSTKTFCTSDASLPVFDMFPNSGSVVIKDSNLSLYNQAISGMFDNNYNYELNIYVDDEKIAHHLVNEQPKYSYEEKTLTLYLGNELDIANDLIYEGYTYPLEEQNFLTIFKNILPSLFNITDTKLNDLLAKKYSSTQTYAQYFATINVPYPYVSSKPYREVLRNLLTIAKCCLYEDENKDLVLVRMDGGYAESVDTTTPSANIYNSVNFVLPSQTSVGFVPSVIQQNNYNVAEISCNKVDIVSNKGVGFKDYYDVSNGTVREFTISRETETINGSNYYIVSNSAETSLFDFNSSNTLSSMGMIIPLSFKTLEFEITVPKKTNKNLTSLLSIYDFAYLTNNGTFSKTACTSTINCRIYSDSNYGGWLVYSYKNGIITTGAITNNSINNTLIQKEINYDYKNEIVNQSVSEKNLKYTFSAGEPIIKIKSETDTDFVVKFSNILIGYKFYLFDIYNSTTFDGYYATLENASFDLCEINSSNMQVSLLGDTYEIQFNGKTLTAPSNVSPAHKMTIENGGGLMQYTGDINATSFPVQYALDLLGWHNGGIRTGQLSVIKDVYTNYSDDFETISIYENLPAGSSKIITDNSIKSWGIYQLAYASTSTSTIYNGATFSNLSISIINGQITITNNGSSSIRLRQITKFSTSNIVGQAKHKVFKCGDLIVPCKDYQYTPIMTNSSGQPIIYQVVEAETFGEGGAVFQTLQVREVKSTKANELPYYLVANENGITICIKDNGYATEGTNNEIIQIGWQT